MKILRYIILFLLIATNAFAADKYVDCSGGLGGAGTFADPYKSVEDLNDNKGGFSTGDDVYFKVGETCTTTEKLLVTWTGTSGNYVIIGAYEGDGDFVLEGGETKPTIDGNSYAVPSVEGGLVQVNSSSYNYITFQDLHIFEAGWYGIMIKYSDYINVYRCLIDYSWKSGCNAFQSDYVKFDSNITTENCQINNPNRAEVMGCLTIAAQGQQNVSAIISNNTVYNNWCSENIGIDRGMIGGLVEYNTLYDNEGTPGIYLDYSKNIIVRYNVLYRSGTYGLFNGMGYALHVTAEPYGYWHGCFNSGHRIYGNMVGGLYNGVNMGYEECAPTDVKLYNNTLVDSSNNNVHIDTSGGGSGNEFKYNISWILDDGGTHTNTCTPDGWTWDKNLWDSDPGTGSCDDADDPVNGSPVLARTTNWDALPAGEVTSADFALTASSTLAINTGLFLTTITTGTGSGTTFIVADSKWFWVGDEIKTAGGQTGTILSINGGTNQIVLTSSIDWVQNEGITHESHFIGAAPDIGADEFDAGGSPVDISDISPSDGVSNVALTQDLTWTNGAGVTDTDVYFDATDCSTEVNNDSTAEESYDTGTMIVSTEYHWKVILNEGGADEVTYPSSGCYTFTTTSGPPVVAENKGDKLFNINAGDTIFNINAGDTRF